MKRVSPDVIYSEQDRYIDSVRVPILDTVHENIGSAGTSLYERERGTFCLYSSISLNFHDRVTVNF